MTTTWTRSWAALAVLAAAALPLGAQPCPTAYNGQNGPRSLFLNVHNCGTGCARQELPYLELFREGISGVRIAPVPRDRGLAPRPEFYTVNDHDPYFEGALEIFGPEQLLVLVDDGIDEGPHAKPAPADVLRLLASVLDRWPRLRHIELLNEPLNFSNITPEEYVHRYLRPARELIDQRNAQRAPEDKIILYSAAWFGNGDGVRQTRRMIRSGGLAYADALAAHIYSDRRDGAVELARAYKRMARGTPVAVTETNFNASNRSNYDTQGWWLCESMTAMEGVLRQGLTPSAQSLQLNVLYTLRADEARFFNLIRFPDKARELFWAQTGPGHTILQLRSNVPTDPKPERGAGSEGGGDGGPGNGGPGGGSGGGGSAGGERHPGRGQG